MADRTISVPGQGAGPASYTLQPSESFSLRSVTWRQQVNAPVSALVPAVPELLAYSPEGLLIGRISAPAVTVGAPASSVWLFVGSPSATLTDPRVNVHGEAILTRVSPDVRGVVWDTATGGVLRVLDPLPPFTRSRADDINDAGEVVGSSFNNASTVIQATKWSSGGAAFDASDGFGPSGPVPPGALAGTFGARINNGANVLGYIYDYRDASPTYTLTPYYAGTDYPALRGIGIDQNYGLNQWGAFCGQIRQTPGAGPHSAFYYDGSLTIIETNASDDQVTAWDLDNTGRVLFTNYATGHLKTWTQAGGVVDLGQFGVLPNVPKGGLNNGGDVVYLVTGSPGVGGFAINAQGNPNGANLPLPGYQANDISEAGVVVGFPSGAYIPS